VTDLHPGAEAEAMMSSVERIKYYIDEIAQEEDDSLPKAEPPPAWPEKGQIEAANIKMRYRDGPLILNGLSFKIADAESIGIVGRTGSGKSSLIVALFRMEKLEAGAIFIDGIDISTIPLRTLRSRLSIIPQVLSLLTIRLTAVRNKYFTFVL